MSNDKPLSTPWWQTLPGILTATAALLPAIGGLVVAVHQAGLTGRTSDDRPGDRSVGVQPPAVSRAAPAPPGTPTATTAEPTAPTTHAITLGGGTEVRAAQVGDGAPSIPVPLTAAKP